MGRRTFFYTYDCEKCSFGYSLRPNATNLVNSLFYPFHFYEPIFFRKHPVEHGRVQNGCQTCPFNLHPDFWFEKSRFVSNPRKMSGSVNPDFSRVSTLKKSWVYTINQKKKLWWPPWKNLGSEKKFQGGNLEKSLVPPSKTLFRVQIKRLTVAPLDSTESLSSCLQLRLSSLVGFIYLLVFPFVYQFNSRIGVLVHSSFAND